MKYTNEKKGLQKNINDANLQLENTNKELEKVKFQLEESQSNLSICKEYLNSMKKIHEYEK